MAAPCPEVSVILPVYNVGEYLDICMESLERQTFRDFEALLINDGSTDDSAVRCRVWAEKDGRKTEAGRGTVPPLYPFLQAR